MSTLKVGTIQDHSNSNTAISIDSSGRVTLPQRVAFMGKKTDTSTLSANSSTNITFKGNPSSDLRPLISSCREAMAL